MHDLAFFYLPSIFLEYVGPFYLVLVCTRIPLEIQSSAVGTGSVISGLTLNSIANLARCMS